MTILSDKNINQLLKPCSNKNYGAFYAIIIISLLSLVVAGFVLYKVCEFLYNKISLFLEAHKEKKILEKESSVRLERFKNFEKRLFVSDNTVFYSIRSYKNSKETLTMYVDFYVRNAQAQYEKVSDDINLYLNETVGYGLPSYSGKSKKLEGSKILIGMGQMYLEQSLTKAYGGNIKVEQLDPVYVEGIV